MRMAPIQCREQAELQRAKALNEPLENRRKIAIKAATAWEAEAVLSEKREAKSRPRDKVDIAIMMEFAMEEAELDRA